MEEFKLESKDIWNAVILISIGLILTMGYLIYNEYSSAKNSCEEIGGEFEYKFPASYYCDTMVYYKYTDGWDYEREFNISNQINLSSVKLP